MPLDSHTNTGKIVRLVPIWDFVTNLRQIEVGNHGDWDRMDHHLIWLRAPHKCQRLSLLICECYIVKGSFRTKQILVAVPIVHRDLGLNFLKETILFNPTRPDVRKAKRLYTFFGKHIHLVLGIFIFFIDILPLYLCLVLVMIARRKESTNRASSILLQLIFKLVYFLFLFHPHDVLRPKVELFSSWVLRWNWGDFVIKILSEEVGAERISFNRTFHSKRLLRFT